METLRTTFNNLVTSMQRYDLYQIDDEVGMGVQKLSDKIDEVYKRMECIDKTAEDMREAIAKFTERVDKNEPFIMDVNHHDSILRGSNDILIATDFEDDEVIISNWYGLFAPKNEEEIVPREINISVDDVVKVAMELGMNPSIEEINEVMGYYNSESEQDSTATWELVVENLLYNCVAPSNQTIEDTVELSGGGIPYRICKHCSIKEEETVMNLIDGVWVCNDCNPPTNLCRVEEIHSIVKDIIAKLNDISVDGETMQYILERVGMDDQMLRQLVMKSSFKDTNDLLREKLENEVLK